MSELAMISGVRPAVIGGIVADKAVLLRQVSETSHQKCEYCDRPNTGRSETCNGCGAPTL